MYILFKKEGHMTIKNYLFAMLVLASSQINSMNYWQKRSMDDWDKKVMMANRKPPYQRYMLLDELCFDPLTADNFDLTNTNRQNLFCSHIIKSQKSILRIFVAAMHDINQE